MELDLKRCRRRPQKALRRRLFRPSTSRAKAPSRPPPPWPWATCSTSAARTGRARPSPAHAPRHRGRKARPCEASPVAIPSALSPQRREHVATDIFALQIRGSIYIYRMCLTLFRIIFCHLSLPWPGGIRLDFHVNQPAQWRLINGLLFRQLHRGWKPSAVGPQCEGQAHEHQRHLKDPHFLQIQLGKRQKKNYEYIYTYYIRKYSNSMIYVISLPSFSTSVLSYPSADFRAA